jgi:hypothetical protein
MNTRSALLAVVDQLETLTVSATRYAEAQGLDPWRAQDQTGQLLLAPLVTARANALAALAILESAS